MKYCEECAALLDLFVDGELPPEEMERVRAHLETCPGCRAYVDDALAMRAGFPDVEDTVVPDGFAGSVMERIRSEERKSTKIVEMPERSARRWVKTLAGLAACCALVILVRTVGSVRSDSATMSAADTAGNTETAVTYTAGPGADPGAGESEERKIEPRTAPAETTTNAEEQGSEDEEKGTTARKRKDETSAYDDTIAGTVSSEGAAYTAGSSAQTEDAAPGSGKTSEMMNSASQLFLTGEEAGNLLDGFTPVWEDGVSSCYNLNAGEYRALLKALGRPAEIQGTEEGTFSVVVKWDLE